MNKLKIEIRATIFCVLSLLMLVSIFSLQNYIVTSVVGLVWVFVVYQLVQTVFAHIRKIRNGLNTFAKYVQDMQRKQITELNALAKAVNDNCNTLENKLGEVSTRLQQTLQLMKTDTEAHMNSVNANLNKMNATLLQSADGLKGAIHQGESALKIELQNLQRETDKHSRNIIQSHTTHLEQIKNLMQTNTTCLERGNNEIVAAIRDNGNKTAQFQKDTTNHLQQLGQELSRRISDMGSEIKNFSATISKDLERTGSSNKQELLKTIEEKTAILHQTITEIIKDTHNETLSRQLMVLEGMKNLIAQRGELADMVRYMLHALRFLQAFNKRTEQAGPRHTGIETEEADGFIKYYDNGLLVKYRDLDDGSETTLTYENSRLTKSQTRLNGQVKYEMFYRRDNSHERGLEYKDGKIAYEYMYSPTGELAQKIDYQYSNGRLVGKMVNSYGRGGQLEKTTQQNVG